MLRNPSLRRLIAFVLAVLAALSGLSNRPTATASSTVTDDTAQVVVAVNRGVNQIQSASCTLDGAPVACGTPTSAGNKASTYTVSLSALTIGTHTFTITVQLTDRGTAKATTTFEVVAPPKPPTFVQVCTTAGGSVEPHLTGPLCNTTGGTGDFSGLATACAAEGGQSAFYGYPWCINPTSVAMREVCRSAVVPGAGVVYRTIPDEFVCRTANPGTTYPDQIQALCTQLGGVFAAAVIDDPDLGRANQYTCAPG